MNIHRIIAIVKKEVLHIIRDRRSLGMAIAIPVLLIFLFGSSLSLDVDNVPLVIWDQNNTDSSRELAADFTASRYFYLTSYLSSYDEIEQAIDRRDAVLALVIPYDFGHKLKSGQSADVQLIVDGSDSNTATISIGYAQGVINNYNSTLLIKTAYQKGRTGLTPPLTAAPRVWFNQNLQAKNYIIPGLIAVIMMVIAALLTSLTIAREWENGTMEQLITTPLKPIELIIGKLTPYFIIALLDVLLAMLMGQFIFDVPLRGNPLFIFMTGALFLLGSLTMGILISVIARSQLLACQLAMVSTFLPSFLLSGFMFTISNMPTPIQIISYLIPARYFVTIAKSVYLKGAGIEVLYIETGILILFTVILIIIASVKLKKKVV